jgi:bifunctional ADP-heptose synthase (sugar kinase/adenylyltransferase)
VTVVTGHFDPLLARHARRLNEIAEPGGVLVTVVTESARPILEAKARAELVAALEMVDYVVVAEGPALEELLGGLQADRIFREEAADQRRAQDLIAQIHRKGSGCS